MDGKRQHRKTISTDRCLARYQHMSPTEINEEIRVKSQQGTRHTHLANTVAHSWVVHLHRPTSPSGRMIALSRRLTLVGLSDLPVGTPPVSKQDSTLSRKVKSELNLMGLRYAGPSLSLSGAATSDTLRIVESVAEEHTLDASLLVEDALECNALIALKELGALVARRKGLHVSHFVNGVMDLIASGHATKTNTEPSVHAEGTQVSQTQKDEKAPDNDCTPRTPLRKPASQLQHRPDQQRRRHFSFEPGDDQMRLLEAGISSSDSLSQTDSTDSESSSPVAFQMLAEGSPANDDSIPLLASLGEDLPKPSMIPSPVQMMGSVRRENSMSNLQSVFLKNIQDDRHSSRTSIQTAFREASSANASIKSKSGDNSGHDLRAAESPLGSKERLNSLANRHSTAALAAARAAEARNNSLSRSNTRLSTATSSSRKLHTVGKDKSDNNDTKTRNNAGEKQAK